ncbi:MAG: PD40 domain-containing protein [Flavobacteriales bacterium]|nr:PD40 domain-containing protein [Flavobacteriales bacterium]
MKTRFALLFLLEILHVGNLIAQPPTAISYSGLQPITSLNQVNGGDGYPWISEDGTRMYYTRSGSPNIRIVYTERSAPGSAWSTPVDALPLETGETSGAWLANDELTIWFTTASNAVKRATRPSIGSPFDLAATLSITGASGTLRSPSITPDGQQMILWRTNGNIVLQAIGPDSFSNTGPLDVLGAVNATTCRMSPDGLVAYFSATRNGAVVPHRMNRSSLADPFGNLEYLDGNGFDPSYDWIQSHLALNEEVLLVVRGQSLWSDNDLFEGTDATGVGLDGRWKPAHRVGPSPTTGLCTLTLDQGGMQPVLLCDLQGRVLAKFLTDEGQLTVDLSEFPAGLYLLRGVEQPWAVRVVKE